MAVLRSISTSQILKLELLELLLSLRLLLARTPYEKITGLNKMRRILTAMSKIISAGLFLLHLHVLSTNITLRTLLQKCVVQQPRNVKTIGMQRALLLPAISYKMVKYIVKPNGMRLLARWSLQSTLQRTLIRLQLLLQHMRTCFTLVGLPHLSPLCLSETTNLLAKKPCLLANILVHSPIDQLFYQ